MQLWSKGCRLATSWVGNIPRPCHPWWYWFRSPALYKNLRKNWARQCVAGTEALCEAAKGRPTRWCIFEDMRDARTREQPLMGAAGVKWCWPKRVTSYGVLCRASGLRLPKPFGAQPVVSWVPDARHSAAEFSVSPDGFLSFFIPVLPCYALILPFSNGNVHSIPFISVVYNLFFILQAHTKRLIWVRGKIGFWTFGLSYCWNC